MAKLPSFYKIKVGDTLSEVSHRFGTSVKELCKINGIKNPNKIRAGDIIAVNRRAVCKIGLILIDSDRNPIPSAEVRLQYSGKLKTMVSRANGAVPWIVTETPEDIVKISLKRGDSTWKKVAEVISGFGNKLVTLKSPKLKINTHTRLHPREESGKPVLDATEELSQGGMARGTPISATSAGQALSTFGDGKGLKIRNELSSSGVPVARITNDQVALDFLQGYTGHEITAEDYRNAAQKIGCEVAVIKAVAKVESRADAFDRKNRPTILYERHVFARCTQPMGKYDKQNPDVSGLHKPYIKSSSESIFMVKTGRLRSYDLYGQSYAKLAKACSLDKIAALKACSWGKFQILGENHALAGYSTVDSFVKAMCCSEREHLSAFVNFVKSSKALTKAAITKDWATFALFYNGRDYKKYNYHNEMKEAYEYYAK